jgi:tyrosinase
MYLLCFEQIVRAAIAKLGGPSDWALPYWNYSDAKNANGRKLPPAFRASRLPDGSANPLFVQARDSAVLAGGDMPPTAVSLRCLRDTMFTGTGSGASPGFGGPKTVFSHVGQVAGALETTPHGDIHMAVGGASVGGWMTSFETAALDPIFWLHHSNIDRLWQVWLGRDPKFVNPPDPDWLNAKGALFPLHDANGNAVSFTPRQVVDTTAAPLGYKYEDVSDPLAVLPTHAALAMGTPMSKPDQPAEMVGALAGVELAAEPTTVEVPISAPKGPAAVSFAVGPPPRTYLNLENVIGEGRLTSFAVYLNVPEGSGDPHQHEALFAGTVPMFGVREATRTDSEHGGGGVTYVLDVTDVVEHLKTSGSWDPSKLRVTFAPVSAAAPGAKARVGRVSLFYQ